MPSLFFTCPKTRQQADTGIMTDAESLRDTWSMTLNVNCLAPVAGKLARCGTLSGDQVEALVHGA